MGEIVFHVTPEKKEEKPIEIKFTRITKTEVKITAVNPKDKIEQNCYNILFKQEESKDYESAPCEDLQSFVNIIMQGDSVRKISLPNL